jgi:hypothetical protein
MTPFELISNMLEPFGTAPMLRIPNLTDVQFSIPISQYEIIYDTLCQLRTLLDNN